MLAQDPGVSEDVHAARRLQSAGPASFAAPSRARSDSRQRAPRSASDRAIRWRQRADRLHRIADVLAARRRRDQRAGRRV